eukprot:gb/GFBE01010101.1/.p1 GENE.gb/GFBE01010101.1/~~gb/GFBE01010101.1/.p1  ORF type:complete len:213 (+),score=29.36 gb/GFBE01010101.1/:1-639(+)
MTLQMDDNRRYTPSDWLIIQKTEFNKEADIRMSMSYGDFSGTLKKEVKRVEPAILPQGVKRLPENREMACITKGWNSKAYRNMDPLRPEVTSNRPSRQPSAGSDAGSRLNGLTPNNTLSDRPAMELDTSHSVPDFNGPSTLMSPSAPSKPRQQRTPLLARTVVNAPLGLGLNRTREIRTPKSASTSSLMVLDRTGDSCFSGCRRTGACGIIF